MKLIESKSELIFGSRMKKIISAGITILSAVFLASCDDEYHRLTTFTGDGEFFAVQNTLHNHNEVLIYNTNGQLLHTLTYQNQIVGSALHDGKLVVFEGGGSPEDSRFDSTLFRYKSKIHECLISKEPVDLNCNEILEVRGGLACPFHLKDQLYFFSSEYRNTSADWKFRNPKISKIYDINTVQNLEGQMFWPSGCPIVYNERVHHATAGLIKKHEHTKNRAVEVLIDNDNFEIMNDPNWIEDDFIHWTSIPDLRLRIVSDQYNFYRRCVKIENLTCQPDDNFIGLSINERGIYEAKMVPDTKERIQINQLRSFLSD